MLPNFDILYEDAQIIVCRKPAGIAVQSARAGQPDMVSILKNYLYKSNAAKEHPVKKEPYLAVIHRLDQPVEGVLVFAKTPFAAKELNKEMQSGGFGKHYHARVKGRPPKDSDTIENYMVKDGRTNTSCICSKDTKGAKLARLTYTVIPSDNTESDATLLDILLDTGRHHQIRVQMANLGCPLIGDQKYGNVVQTDAASSTSFQPRKPRTKLELCAYKLEFHHPKTKQLMEFLF